MEREPKTLCRFGAWGQVGTIILAVIFWSFEMTDGFLAACVGYLLVTMVGIVGIARAESVIAGPIVYPFLIPGFVPLYYFGTQETDR